MSKRTPWPPLPEGITKDIVRWPPSERYMKPQVGDLVEVHYVGTLKADGSQFDSSKERGQTFKFKVGSGEVIEGWDLGVRTMYKGETAKFTMMPQFAYGTEGREGVPSDSTVVLEVELVSYPKREDLYNDGGVILTEVSSGPGKYEPRGNEEVQMSFKISVDGEVIQAARHSVYQIGSGILGRISQAIDKALRVMHRGDEVVLMCTSAYSFGTGEGRFAGKSAKVTLILEQIHEVLDVSIGGAQERNVMKKRLIEGDGTEKPHDLAKVTLSVESVVANGERIMEGSLPREMQFEAGSGEVCDALEGACLEMRLNEVALVRCERADTCAGGLLALPERLDVPVLIQCKMLRFQRVLDKLDMKDFQRIERCRERKEMATELFKRGRIRLASHHYELITNFFSQAELFRSAEDQDAGKELRRIARLNQAMCMLKLRNWKVARTLCDSVIKEDPCNAKALFRRGTAVLEMRDYDKAIADFQRLLELEPASADGRKLLQQAKRAKRDTDKRQSPVFSRMCDALGTLPEPTRKDDDVVCMPEHLRYGYKAPAAADTGAADAVSTSLEPSDAASASTAAAGEVATAQETATPSAAAADLGAAAPGAEEGSATESDPVQKEASEPAVAVSLSS